MTEGTKERIYKSLQIIGQNPGITKADLCKEICILPSQFAHIWPFIKDKVEVKEIREYTGLGGKKNTYYLR